MASFPQEKAQYQVLHKIHSGKKSNIYLARCLINDHDLIITTINLEGEKINKIADRISSLYKNEDQYLVSYYGSFIYNSELWILSQFMECGSFSDIISFLYPNGISNEIVISTILKSILYFLSNYHKESKVYYNLCVQNILLSIRGYIKLQSIHSHQGISNINYYPPEFENENLLNLSEKADIWDLGITAIELVTGKPPNRDSIINELKTGNLSLKSISPLFADFLNCCLKIKPEKRQTADQLLQHKFIKQAKDNSLLAIEISAIMISMNQLREKIEQMDHSNPDEHKSIKVDFDFDFTEHGDERPPPKIEEKVVGRFKLKGDHSILDHYE